MPGCAFSARTKSPKSPRTNSAFQSTLSSVDDTTYFFAALIALANGFVQSGNASEAGGRHACIKSYVTRPNSSASASGGSVGARLRGLGGVFKIDFHRSMWKALGDYFRDPRLRQLFGRYATYYGSDPFTAPATLNLIAHVEQLGVWTVEGGMFELLFVFDNYPFKAPKITFQTKIYHPNISDAGEICHEIYESDWVPTKKVRSIMGILRSMLISPNPASPIREEIAQQFAQDYDGYCKTAREWTVKHASG